MFKKSQEPEQSSFCLLFFLLVVASLGGKWRVKGHAELLEVMKDEESLRTSSFVENHASLLLLRLAEKVRIQNCRQHDKMITKR